MSRYTTAAEVTKQSLNHLWAQPRLFTFPGVAIVGGSAVLWIVFIHMTAPTAVLITWILGSYSINIQKLAFAYSMVFEVYVLGVAVLSFCNAGLVYCSNQSWDGEDVSVRDGFLTAARSLPTILLYAVFHASIGTVLQFLERRFDSVQRLLCSIVGFGIGLLTFFVIPIAVLEEDRSIVETFTKSGQLGGQMWGETGGTSLAITTVVMIPFSTPFLLLVLSMLFDMVTGTRIAAAILARNWLLFVIAAIALLGLVISSYVTAVAKTTLYREAVDGDAISGNESMAESVVKLAD